MPNNALEDLIYVTLKLTHVMFNEQRLASSCRWLAKLL